MPRIWIEESTNKRLQEWAKPLEDTHETVIAQLLDSADEGKAKDTLRSNGAKLAEEAWQEVQAYRERQAEGETFWHDDLPELKDTEIAEAHWEDTAGNHVLERDKQTWNGVLQGVLATAVGAMEEGRLPWVESVEDLREKSGAPVREGPGGEKGWHHLDGQGRYSYQGQSQDQAAQSAVAVATVTGMGLEVLWYWSEERYDDETRRKGRFALAKHRDECPEGHAPAELAWDAGEELFRHTRVKEARLNGVRVQGQHGRRPTWADIVGAVAEIVAREAGGKVGWAKASMGMRPDSGYLHAGEKGIRYTGKAAQAVQFIARAFRNAGAGLDSLEARIWWDTQATGAAYPGQTSVVRIGRRVGPYRPEAVDVWNVQYKRLKPVGSAEEDTIVPMGAVQYMPGVNRSRAWRWYTRKEEFPERAKGRWTTYQRCLEEVGQCMPREREEVRAHVVLDPAQWAEEHGVLGLELSVEFVHDDAKWARAVYDFEGDALVADVMLWRGGGKDRVYDRVDMNELPEERALRATEIARIAGTVAARTLGTKEQSPWKLNAEFLLAAVMEVLAFEGGRDIGEAMKIIEQLVGEEKPRKTLKELSARAGKIPWRMPGSPGRKEQPKQFFNSLVNIEMSKQRLEVSAILGYAGQLVEGWKAEQERAGRTE